MAVLVVIAPMAHAVGWVRPATCTSDTDWTNCGLAYDNNNNTYASDTAPGTVPNWDGWITFTMAAPILCNQIKVYGDYGESHVDNVQMDVYNTAGAGAWETVYTGAINDAAWFTTPIFTARTVSQLRFRYHFYAGGYVMWLREVLLYNCPPVVTTPTIATLNAASIDTNSVKFQGLIQNDGGATCTIWFEYGPTTAYGTSTATQTGYNTGDIFGTFQGGLTTGSSYHFRANAQNSAGAITGDDVLVKPTAPIAGAWVDPTSSSADPSPPAKNSGQWATTYYAYDDDAKTASTLALNVGDTSPGMYLYLNHAAITCDKITVTAKKTNDINGIDIWVYKGGAWVNVYPTATFVDNTPLTVSFAAGSVTQARVRFTTNNVGLSLCVYAFDFHIVGVEHSHGFIDGTFSGADK